MKRINVKNNIIIMIIIGMFLIPISSYAAFYDINYPPNSSGHTDYTDEEADKQKENVKINTSDQYVGKSSNNYLKSLTVENAIMKPQFNRQYVDYKLELKNESVRKINIEAVAEDENAIIQGAGEIEIKDGINNIRILVAAENGNVQIYNLNLELPFKQSDMALESLEIYGVNIKTGQNKKTKLTPNFEKKIYEYCLELEYEIISLDIKAKTAQDAYISIIGGNDLEVGDNKILIEVIDKENENIKTTYIVNAKRKEAKKINYIPIVLISIFTVIIIASIIIMLKKQKSK